MTSLRMKPTTTAFLALLLGLVLTGTARASDWGFSIQIGRPAPVVVRPFPPPAPVVTQIVRQWAPAHYETRTEEVLASPAHYEWQYVAPVYGTRYDRRRRAESVCVQAGHWTQVYVPARYETRTAQVLAPGCYRDVTVSAPASRWPGEYTAFHTARPQAAVVFGR